MGSILNCVDNILQKSMPEHENKEFCKQTHPLLKEIIKDKDPLNKARNLNNLFQILESVNQIMELPEDESNNTFIEFITAIIKSLTEQ
jgi:hypothetical protein